MVATGSTINYAPTSLGCGDYKVFYRDRCSSQTLLCEADVISGSFNRILNDISEASIEVRLRSDSTECCGCYGVLSPWQHELVIYRDKEEVWTGPIQRIELDFKAGTGEVFARDLLAWADRRLIEISGDDDYDVEDVDLKDVFEWVLLHGYQKDPWCMTWGLETVNVPVSRLYPAYGTGAKWGGTYLNCGDELRDLSSAGIDYTVIKRHLWGGNIEVNTPVPITGTLLDGHFIETPRITISGEDMVTRLVYGGGNSGYSGWDEDQMWVEPPSPYGPITPAGLNGNQGQYGLLERVQKKEKMEDVDTSVVPNALTQAAFGEYELFHTPFIYIESGTLAPTAPLDFDSLIPGSKFDVRLSQTCRIVFGSYRLHKVEVSFGSGVEQVGLQLTPVGVDELRSA